MTIALMRIGCQAIQSMGHLLSRLRRFFSELHRRIFATALTTPPSINRCEQNRGHHVTNTSTRRREDGTGAGWGHVGRPTTRRKRLALPQRASRCPPSAWPDRRWAAAPRLQRAPRHGGRAVSEVATPRHAAAGRRRFLAAARLLRRGRDDGTGRPAAPRIRLTTRTRARPHSARGRYTTAASRPLVITTSGGTPHP